MSITSALEIATGGLANISQQLSVISNNIANASTPGYAEEVSTQTSLTANGQGFGVFTGPVQRQINLQLQAQLFQQTATVAALQTTQAALQPIDAAQGTPGAGTDLGSQLGNLQTAFTALAGNPSSSAGQTQVVNAASALTSQINTLSAAYTTARQNAQTDIQDGLTQLNDAVSTISQLTDQIVAAQQGGQSTADLENQRDTAMASMSALVGVNFIKQPNGGLLASTSGGLAINMATPAPQFSMANSTISPQTTYPSGGIQGIMLNGTDVTNSLTGGSIGADITLRDKTLPTYQAELDEFSNTLQARFSSQGLVLFSAPAAGSTALNPAPVQTGYVGYAATISVNPAVTASPAEVTDGNVAVVGSSSNAAAFTPNPSTGPASFDTLINNVVAYTFGSQAQPGVPQPAPNVVGLGPLGTLVAPFGVPQTLSGFATSLIDTQSADVANTTTDLGTEQTVQTALQAQVSSASGVNTDNELSNMVALQNSYGANARVIAAAQAMWTQLITSVS
jgi:flagellar hook-associated protein 1 FlgK